MRNLVKLTAIALFLLGTVTTTVSAQAGQIVSGFENPSSQTTRADLERFVDGTPKFTSKQVQAYYGRLTLQQQETFRQTVRQRIAAVQVPASLRATKPPPPDIAGLGGDVRPNDAYGNCIESGYLECWKQDVEYTDAQPRVGPTTWYADVGSCDNEFGDTEYIFYIPVGLNRDPDGARWNTTNGALYTAALARDRTTNQPGFGYSYSEIRLCFSDTILGFAGLDGNGAAATISGRYGG